MASSTFNENDNGFRATKLLLKGGGYLTKEMLEQHAITGSNTTMDQFLAQPNVLNKINNLKARNYIHVPQYDILYPSNNSPTQLDEWDITLTTLILINCLSTLSQAEERVIKDIRDLRNTLYGHTAKVEMTNGEFKQKWTDISSALTKHVTVLTKPTCAKVIKDLILATEIETLSADESIETLKKMLVWKIENENMFRECHDQTRDQITKENHELCQQIKEIKTQDKVKDLHEIEDKLYELIEKKNHIVRALKEGADLLEKLRNVKVGLTATSAVGGAISTFGFVLSFFTMGVTLPLVAVGGIVSAAVGVPAFGVDVADVIESRSIQNKLEDFLVKYNSKCESLKRKCIRTGCKLNDYGNIDFEFPSWVSFFNELIFGGKVQIGEKITWGCFVLLVNKYSDQFNSLGRKMDLGNRKVVLDNAKIISTSDDVILESAKSGSKAASRTIGSSSVEMASVSAFKKIGSTTGKLIHIAGGVFGVGCVLYDIYTIAKEVDRPTENPNFFKLLRDKANEIANTGPTKEQVDKMIQETLAQIQA